MLGFIVLISAIVFAIIVPIWALLKYYSPSEHSLFSNIFWIVVGIITWPLVPIVMVTRRRDKTLLSLFWISFLVMAVSGWYWVVLNVEKLIHIQTTLMS